MVAARPEITELTISSMKDEDDDFNRSPKPQLMKMPDLRVLTVIGNRNFQDRILSQLISSVTPNIEALEFDSQPPER
jgi:hypothetical protein